MIDVGSGQGYLSLAVAMLSGVEVVGIDSMPHNGEAALQRMKRVAGQKGAPPCLFHSVTHSIQPGEDFSHLLEPFLSLQEGRGCRRVLLLGLHACGDLTATFLRSSTGPLGRYVVAIMSIGCCYQNLSEASPATGASVAEGIPPLQEYDGPSYARVSRFGEDNDGTILVRGLGEDEIGLVAGFPMSAELRQISQGALFGRHTRTLGAQSLCLRGDAFRWTLKRQFYRSSFQLLLHRHHDGFVAPHKLGVKSKEGLGLDFSAYARMAAAGCGLPEELAAEIIERHAEALIAELLPLRTSLYLLWTLRAVLGHCVEALVLLDRLTYLEETGFNASLRVVFDGDESPRNVAVVAWRRGQPAV